MKRLAVPDKLELPMNETVPALAVSEPSTDISEVMEKLTDVETLPVIFNPLNVIEPVPLIVFELPLIVIVPAEAEKDVPLTAKFPVIDRELPVLMDPEAVRLLNDIPVPVMLFDVPLIVTVPEPPEVCVNVPAPLVEKSPAIVRFVDDAVVTPWPVITRSPKLFVPEPLMLAFSPVIVRDPEPEKDPSLVQFPPTVCE